MNLIHKYQKTNL